jgi:hypothetical protein
MPGLDRSGPMGAGSMTGGRRGICGRAGGSQSTCRFTAGGTAMAEEWDSDADIGRGRGYGFGPAYGGVPYPQAYGTGYPVSKTDEMEMLRADAEAMRQSLDAIQRRLADLEKEGSE